MKRSRPETPERGSITNEEDKVERDAKKAREGDNEPRTVEEEGLPEDEVDEAEVDEEDEQLDDGDEEHDGGDEEDDDENEEDEEDVDDVGKQSEEPIDPEVASIMEAIKAKPEWTRKVADPDIAKRYATEAAQQGASATTIATALRLLLKEAVMERGVDCTLELPDGGRDRDFYVGEYDDVHTDGVMKADEVRFVDGLVPEELRALLEEQLDAIANEPEKDFHPGSDGKVQDLIHPSLYPYIRGLSYVREAEDEEDDEDEEEEEEAERGDDDEAGEHEARVKDGEEGAEPSEKNAVDAEKEEQKEGEEEAGDGDEDDDEEEETAEDTDHDNEEENDVGSDGDWYEVDDRSHNQRMKQLEELDSVYQWLPAEFDVQPDGEVRVASYINNLDRERHAGLYETIARIFRLFLPLLEQVAETSSYWLPQLYGRKLQVIVKAANYVLQPGQTYEGTWHVEGMPHEKIVASGIYYYSTSPNLPTTCLAFRTQREDDPYDRQSTQNLGFDLNLGKVDTPAGRCLAFSNEFQHKVKAMKNTSDTVGIRKILCFFLVDPDNPIISSADVPEQQWDVVRGKTTLALLQVATKLGTPLPRELVKYIVDLAKWGMTKEEAHMHREVLMKERKYYVDENNRLWQRNYSFCEH